MLSFIKFCYYVSGAFFIFWLFFSYYQFPEFVPVAYSSNTGLNELISKQYIFYFSGGVFLVVNVTIMLLRRLTKSFPLSILPIPNKKFWFENEDSREALVEVFSVWYYSLNWLFNMLLGFILMFLYLVVVTEYGKLSDYQYVVYGLMTTIALWWVVLLVRLMFRTHRID
ncbi:MAG: hypothetical protein SFY32_09145 [Bacteroidota bacterium]|nr:hypothetical protein [Bacteroidota bacterium]